MEVIVLEQCYYDKFDHLDIGVLLCALDHEELFMCGIFSPQVCVHDVKIFGELFHETTEASLLANLQQVEQVVEFPCLKEPSLVFECCLGWQVHHQVQLDRTIKQEYVFPYRELLDDLSIRGHELYQIRRDQRFCELLNVLAPVTLTLYALSLELDIFPTEYLIQYDPLAAELLRAIICEGNVNGISERFNGETLVHSLNLSICHI